MLLFPTELCNILDGTKPVPCAKTEKSEALNAAVNPSSPKRELADPYQRGKLTPHGWRVAYHLARSIKKRKLELPETLPQCLYPHGYVPVVTPPAEGKDEAAGVTETPKNKKGNAGEGAGEKGRKPSVGAAPTARGGKVSAETGEEEGKGKGKGKRKGKSEGGATASGIDYSKSRRKGKEKNGDRKEQAAGKNKKRRSVEGKAASSMPNASCEEADDRDRGEEYWMSKAHQARYSKMFDKVTKRKPVQAIDGAQV